MGVLGAAFTGGSCFTGQMHPSTGQSAKGCLTLPNTQLQDWVGAWPWEDLGRMDAGGDFPGGAVVKYPPANAGDAGWIPGPGRSHMPRSN